MFQPWGWDAFIPRFQCTFFPEEPGLRAAPTAEGVGADPKDFGCFGGGEPGFLGLSRHKQSVVVCSEPTQPIWVTPSLRLAALANQNLAQCTTPIEY